MLQFGQIFELIKLVLFLNTYLGDGFDPSSQILGSLLISLPGKASQENDLNIAPMDSTNSQI